MNTRRFSQMAVAAVAILSTFAFSGRAHAAVGTLYGVTGAGPAAQGSCGGTLSALYTLDPTTGAATLVGPVMIGGTQARHITGLAVHPSTGVMYAVMNGVDTACSDEGDATLLTIDPATGAATVVGTQGSISGQFPDITFDPFGTLYAWNEFDGDSLWIIDTTTGTGTRVDFGDLSTFRTGLASDSKGHLYLKMTNELYRINQYTAKSFGFVDILEDLKNFLAFDQNDVMFSGDRNSQGFFLYTIDPTSGQATFIGSNTVPNMGAITFDRGVLTPPPVSDLSLSKDVDVPNPVIGTDVVFTLTVTNDGPDAADNVTVSDLLPAGYSYVSSSGDGTYDDGTGVWTIGTIASGGAFATIDITATVLNAPGQYTNVAEVATSDSYDPDSVPGSGDEAGDTYAALTPDVLVPKLFSLDRDTNRLWVVDPTFFLIDMAMSITLDGYDLTGGNGLTVQPETGTMFAGLDSSQGRLLATIDPATGEATLIGSFGDYRVSSITFGADQDTLYARTGNSGPNFRTLFTVDPTDATMTAVCTLPEGFGGAMTFSGGLIYMTTEICPNDCFIQVQIIDPSQFPGSASDPCGGTTVDTSILYREPTGVAVESDVGGTITLLVASFGELYRVTIPGAGSPSDSSFLGSMSHQSRGLAFSTADVTLASLSASKTATKMRVKGKKLIDYTIGGGNSGPSSLSNVELTDNLPPGTTFVSADSGCDLFGGTVVCSIGQLDPGVTQFFTFTVQLTCKKCSSVTNNVSVSADGMFYDYPYDNVASSTLSVKGKF